MKKNSKANSTPSKGYWRDIRESLEGRKCPYCGREPQSPNPKKINDINEIWLAIEELKKDSHPPVDWMEIINSLITRVESLENKIENLEKRETDGQG